MTDEKIKALVSEHTNIALSEIPASPLPLILERAIRQALSEEAAIHS